jgi:hypothetical protein
MRGKLMNVRSVKSWLLGLVAQQSPTPRREGTGLPGNAIDSSRGDRHQRNNESLELAGISPLFNICSSSSRILRKFVSCLVYVLMMSAPALAQDGVPDRRWWGFPRDIDSSRPQLSQCFNKCRRDYYRRDRDCFAAAARCYTAARGSLDPNSIALCDVDLNICLVDNGTYYALCCIDCYNQHPAE